MRFRNYCGETVEIERGVMANFDYLADKELLSPGDYKTLKKIFAGDHRAIQKIDKALNMIDNLKSTAESSNSKKGKFFGHHFIGYLNKYANIKKEQRLVLQL